MTDDEPERFTPPRPAIPVRTKQEQRVADAEAEAQRHKMSDHTIQIGAPGQEIGDKNFPAPDIMRSIRARKAWQTRRANRTVKSTPPPDRHRPAVFTAKEVVELARLMVDYPFLRRLVE